MLAAENNIKENVLNDIENEAWKNTDPIKANEKIENTKKALELRDITYVNSSHSFF